MDGIHDLGGRQGFGPIETDAPPFRHDWEWRGWALAKCATMGFRTIDESRFIIERLPPALHLTAPYFEKWALRDLCALVLSGKATLEEAARGHADRPETPPAALDLAAAMERLRANEAEFTRPAPAPPAFVPGDRVRTKPRGHSGHTRLPAYARAATGTVIAHHGAHVFADTSAEGDETTAHHLYTVELAAADLFDDADPADTVLLDLWEPYLDRA